MSTLREVLDHGFPVWHHPEFDSLITWNGRGSFLWWNLDGKSWENTDIQTSLDHMTVDQAERVAQAWAAEEGDAW